MIRFFMPCHPPTATHQTKAVRVVKGKATFYEPRPLQEARAMLSAHLAPHRPAQPMAGPIRCVVKWCFPSTNAHPQGSWRLERPDTHNLNKLLFDVMTDLGFWLDDAQVVSEIIEKFYATPTGIFVQIEAL